MAETKETLDTRTEECKNLMVSVTDLQQFLRREKDSAIELQKKDTDSQKLLEEQGQVRAGKVIVKTNQQSPLSS